MTHEDGAQPAPGRNKRRLKIVFVLTASYLIAEVVGGLLTHSLALLADAGHMLTDVGGLALALAAINFSERKATPAKTYGYYRMEILAALANAVLLIGVSLYILYEAYQRFRNPPEVQSGAMLVVAGIGLVVNVAGVVLLRAGSKESLNMKGAYFEVISDMLTSVGVIVAALVMITTGWYYADPLISAGIGLFILPRTWAMMKQAVDVLLEGTPAGVNIAAMREDLLALPGVAAVHDLHVWSLTSGVNAMSVHLSATAGMREGELLQAARRLLDEKFRIEHTTIQVEAEANICEAPHA